MMMESAKANSLGALCLSLHDIARCLIHSEAAEVWGAYFSINDPSADSLVNLGLSVVDARWCIV